MMTKHVSQRFLLLFLAFFVSLPALGQAWLPEKGEGNLSFSYTLGRVDDHVFSRRPDSFAALFPIFEMVPARRFDAGTIDSRTSTFGFSYGITDRLAIDSSIAQVGARYQGILPEAPNDDGKWHSALQDLSIDLRYQVVNNENLVFTMSLGTIQPVGKYESLGHTALGKDLSEYSLGTYLGVPLGPAKQSGYFQFNYTYSMVEDVMRWSLDRQNASAELGLFASNSILLRGFGFWQDTVDGMDWANDLDPNILAAAGVHDVAANADFWGLGTGAVASVSSALDVYLTVSQIVDGSNTHILRTWTFGVVYNFGRNLQFAPTTDRAGVVRPRQRRRQELSRRMGRNPPSTMVSSF